MLDIVYCNTNETTNKISIIARKTYTSQSNVSLCVSYFQKRARNLTSVQKIFT